MVDLVLVDHEGEIESKTPNKVSSDIKMTRCAHQDWAHKEDDNVENSQSTDVSFELSSQPSISKVEETTLSNLVVLVCKHLKILTSSLLERHMVQVDLDRSTKQIVRLPHENEIDEKEAVKLGLHEHGELRR